MYVYRLLTINMNKLNRLLIFFQILCSTLVYSQDKNLSTTGVSVAPSHYHLTQDIGEQKTYDLTINNNTSSLKQFNITIKDFNLDEFGEPTFVNPGEGEFSLAEWLNITPNFIELKPNETKKVKVTVSIPNTIKAARAAWSILLIEQEKPSESIIKSSSEQSNTIALGVVPTYAFGVFMYQNPPNVTTDKISVKDFNYDNESKTIFIRATNQGTGINYCKAYIDLTNLDTGEQQRLNVKSFTILPNTLRDFTYSLKSLKKGNYLAVGVLDFEGSEEIQAAKLEFNIN